MKAYPIGAKQRLKSLTLAFNLSGMIFPLKGKNEGLKTVEKEQQALPLHSIG